MCSHTPDLLARPGRFISKYWLGSFCDKGSYGSVNFARDADTAEDVVIKIECGTILTFNEKAAYNTLVGISGIPRCHEVCRFRNHGIIVLERLGHNLKKYAVSCGGSLPISEVYVLGKALVKILQDIHDRGVIHRDVKPENILLPINGELQPHIVDFGHAKLYRDPTGKHKPESDECAHGTLPYMSINVHSETRYSRRDDIASLAYTLIYLANGSLPWYGLSATKCLRKKKSFKPSNLTPPLPAALELFLDHAVNLSYAEDPDYSYLMDILN